MEGGTRPNGGVVTKLKPSLPLIDVEKFVPAAITVVRRSLGWHGLFLQERRGGSGEVHYLPGNRQHIFYCFLNALNSDVTTPSGTKAMSYKEGEGRFTPAGLPVVFKWTGEVRVLILGFEPWFLQRIAAELGTSGSVTMDANSRKLPAEHRACMLVQQLAGELDAAAGAPIVAEGLARAIAVLLLREFDRLPPSKLPKAAPPAAVLRAVEVMRNRLCEPLSLEELAHVAALSPFHFARQFKTATGHPPHEYLIRLRVDRAKELIRTQGREWTMAAIAQESGFADQSHMARHFRRVLGVTPRVFADAHPH
ncbi:MAG: Transcriptional regulator, AraC family [Chthoniobacteraceae bacterium]|nr:Transcriptional regulator, AraC family [Chthoniobacteraceae bacterium]